ncbi:diguanylate cyclase [Bradyrhizobium sp. AZCC 1693]|uniref:diguanylate cyclase n=1 Tax=Bradyrhizobium sp. AZCC 1693 TaxID=3117029 RepID=UPI002FEF901C
MTVLRGVLASAKGRTIAAASAILISGLAATFAARLLSERMIAADTQRRFSADAADISTAVGDRLRTHAEVLVSMQGLYASIGGKVDRAQFRRYIDVLDLSRRYPGFQALQSLRQVGPDGLDAFVAEMRGDASVDAGVQPEFTVRPPGKRASYNIVEFVEPMRGNEDALGFDAGANPAQLDSLRRAAETGRIVATPPVKLVQDMSGGLGFILRAPIYRTAEPAQTISQRVAALRGFVASVYRMNDLMRGVLDPWTLQQMQVQIVDRGYAKQTEGTLSGEPEDPSGAATLMYNSLEPNLNLVSQVAWSAGITADRSLVVGERVWRVVFSARPGSIYEVDRLVPNLVLASGVIISLLIALLAIIGLRSRQLSGNLSALDAEQRALVDNPLAGILFTEGRRILRGNRRMAELCGASSDELPENSVDSLLATEADSTAFGAALTTIRDSAMATEAELHLRQKDGSALLIEAYGKPLAAGEILWVVQDKTDAMQMDAERREHARELQESNARLTSSLQAAEIRAKEIVLLTELSGVLQSCQAPNEIFAAVQNYAGFLFPEEAGALYLMNETRDAVTRGPHWGELTSAVTSFPLEDCWALRRGTTFPISPASQGLVCGHAACRETHGSGFGSGYVCQPLVAQNNLMGLLYREACGPAFAEGADQLATMLAEQVSLALANLDLREQLRSQAIRDQLTGLYNRRFLEDALTRETGRAARSGEPVAVAILDVDHFKRINDTYGHEAGDAVLRELGQVLLKTIRKTDIVGRFGGEEFLMLLPGASVDVAQSRGLAVLEAVRAMEVSIPNGAPLNHITASIGVAAMPLHVARGDALVAAADAALYQAKGQGRNRVVLSDRRAILPTPAEMQLGLTGTDG